MPKKTSLESRLIATMQALFANHAATLDERMNSIQHGVVELRDRVVRNEVNQSDQSTRDHLLAHERDVMVNQAPHFSGSTSVKVVSQRSHASKRAAALLEETALWGQAVPLNPPASIGISTDEVERLNLALNGEYDAYRADAHRCVDLLTLSAVVSLRKRIDAQEKLLRFLVDQIANRE